MKVRIALALGTTVALLAVGTAAAATSGSLPGHDAKTKEKKHKAHNSDGMSAAEMAAMESTAKVDDRGFSKLENGVQHTHGFTQALSKADRAVLAHQMVLARETALRYPTVADAEAAGLHRAGPFSPGLGAHYINYGNAAGAEAGVLSDDGVTKPLAWMYDGTHPDSHVIGLFYGSMAKDPEGFAGTNDTWHAHHDICLRGADAPLGADHDATKKECDAVGGSLLKRTQLLLHVWAVPGYESPEGPFAHVSSAVTCDDGSYKTIKDVTKIGSRTTICADGTE